MVFFGGGLFFASHSWMSAIFFLEAKFWKFIKRVFFLQSGVCVKFLFLNVIFDCFLKMLYIFSKEKCAAGAEFVLSKIHI